MGYCTKSKNSAFQKEFERAHEILKDVGTRISKKQVLDTDKHTLETLRYESACNVGANIMAPNIIGRAYSENFLIANKGVNPNNPEQAKKQWLDISKETTMLLQTIEQNNL